MTPSALSHQGLPFAELCRSAAKLREAHAWWGCLAVEYEVPYFKIHLSLGGWERIWEDSFRLKSSWIMILWFIYIYILYIYWYASYGAFLKWGIPKLPWVSILSHGPWGLDDLGYPGVRAGNAGRLGAGTAWWASMMPSTMQKRWRNLAQDGESVKSSPSIVYIYTHCMYIFN